MCDLLLVQMLQTETRGVNQLGRCAAQEGLKMYVCSRVTNGRLHVIVAKGISHSPCSHEGCMLLQDRYVVQVSDGVLVKHNLLRVLLDRCVYIYVYMCTSKFNIHYGECKYAYTTERSRATMYQCTIAPTAGGSRGGLCIKC